MTEAWGCFRANSLEQAFTVLRKSLRFSPWVFTDGSLFKYGLDSMDMNMAVLGIIILIIVDVLNHWGKDLKKSLINEGICFRWAVMIILIMMGLIFGIWGPGYNASTFRYQQF